jgi:catechol 2,3-dioxygenase-like lactoylglutathione lyase family enzyme
MNHIIGIDHVGVGVKNMEAMKKFYKGTLEFTEVFGEMPVDDHEPIHGLVRTSPAVHSATQINQKGGGIAVSLFCHIYPRPRPIRKEFHYGDIGISKTVLAVNNLELFYQEYQARLAFCGPLRRIEIPEWGEYTFVFARDPEGNLIEFRNTGKDDRPPIFGGLGWIGIAVTDLDRSREFYQKHLGFDKTIVDIHQKYSGQVDEIALSSQAQIRSCILGNSRGNGMVELFESLKPRGRSIPFLTNWGDYGYLQMCLLGTGIREVEAAFRQSDLDIVLDPQMITSDDPKNSGLAFMYVRDPDGIPVEVMTLPKPAA